MGTLILQLLRFGMLVLAVLVPVGCSGYRQTLSGIPAGTATLPYAAREALPTVRMLGRQHGTAVYRGDQVFVTCQHVLGYGGALPERIQLNGVWTTYQILASGNGCGAPDDWVYLRSTAEIPNLPPPAQIDPGRSVEPGTTVYIAGYWGLGLFDEDHPIHSPAESASLPLSVIATYATSKPMFSFYSDTSVLYVKAPLHEAYHGISGGIAFIVVDGKRVDLGIYTAFKNGRHLIERFR